jgi:ComF family protein
MKIIKKLYFLVKGFLFPAFCAICEDSLFSSSEIRYGLCDDCLSSLNITEEKKCFLCGKPLISEKEKCLPCRNGTNHSYDRLWVLFPYAGKYNKLLKEYKFKKKLNLAEFFTEKIISVLRENPELKDAVIVPVPPRPGKINELGWDQIDYLIKRLKKNINTENAIKHCLKRKKSKIQKYLSRTERIENLKGRIFLKGKSPKTALVIDDIITTGSTMEVCASVLKKNGTEKVYGLCLFYD